MGKPGGGQSLRCVIENIGGTGQFPSTRAVVRDEPALLVVKMESRPGPDLISLFVNPSPGVEPAAADAVKADLDLGLVTAVALNGGASSSP